MELKHGKGVGLKSVNKNKPVDSKGVRWHSPFVFRGNTVDLISRRLRSCKNPVREKEEWKMMVLKSGGSYGLGELGSQAHPTTAVVSGLTS